MSIQVEEVSADYTGMIVEADYQEYIRFDGTDQATIMPTLVESAIRQAEAYCNASFGSKSYVYQNADVDLGCDYYLPFAPVRQVTAVKHIATDGTETVLTEGTNYVVGGLSRKYISFLSAPSTGAINVEYTTGNLDPANVNKQVKEGILQILSENFENRAEAVIGEGVAMFPRSSRVKLASFRNNVY